MTTWTKTDKWLARVWPFLVMRKVDAIVNENNKIDEEAVWVTRLTTSDSQQAALRIGEQEVSRIERLEDKLDRQQPVTALLIPIATALLTAAWFRGYLVIVATGLLGLVAAAFGLFTAARANVPFAYHTVTVPELEEMLTGNVYIGAATAARSITDSQRNIPRGIGISNRVDAVRRAIFASLFFIVLSAVLFAAPNWGSVGADGSAGGEGRIESRLSVLEREVLNLFDQMNRNVAVDSKMERALRGLRHEVRRLRGSRGDA